MTADRSPGSVLPGDSTPARPALPLIFSITVTGILANTLIAPAIPDIRDDLGISDGAVGLVVSAAAFPGIVIAPIIGLLADRYGRRQVLVPCLVIFGLSGALAGLAPNFGILLAARLAQGVGSAGLINLAVTIIGDHWDGLDRARIIGRNSAVLTVGLAILPPIGGALTDLGGWRLSFAPYLVGLVTAAVIWRRLPPARPDGDPVGLRAQLAEAVGVVRATHIGGVMAIGVVAFLLIFGLVLTALPLHLEEEFGLGASQRGLFLSLPALTSTIGALATGRLHARFRRSAIVGGSSVLFAIAFVAMGLSPVLWGVVLAVLAYGLAEGSMIPALQDTAAGAAPTRSRGAVVALWVGSVRLGQTTGPVAASVTAGAWGTATAFVGGAVLALSLVAFRGTHPVEPAQD